MSECRILLFASLITLCSLHASHAQGTSTLSSGTATLSGGAAIHTALHWNTSAALFTSGDGTVVFMAAGDQTLTPAAGEVFHHIILDKPSGNLVLAGPLAVQGTLTLQQGDLDLNDFTLNLGTMGTLLESAGAAVKGDGSITAQRTLDAPTAENVAGLGAIITSSAALGATTIARGHAPQTGGGNESVRRYYDITPTNNTGLDATLTFSYLESELNGHLEGGLSLYRSEDAGTNWTERGGMVDIDANTVTLTEIDAFSRWTLGSSNMPLPVELVSFEALLNGTSLALQWQTASETNNAGFEIQRKPTDDASNALTPWEVLGWVEGQGTTEEAQHYTYTIAALEPGTHTFRLKQIDYDGTFAYSPMVEVVVGVDAPYHLTSAYPNPFNPQTTFSLAVPVTQPVHIAVFDVLGRQVATLWEGELEAHTSRAFVWEADDRPSGLYFIQVVGKRFIATRQVTLLK